MKAPKISILMPVKNAMPYLKTCIDSILQQNYAHWEIIAVNDSSTDESATVLQEFANQDARISVYENSGNGIIDALKLAYSKSSGTFITRMDADDLMTFDKLTILANQLMQFGPGHLAIGQVKYFQKMCWEMGFSNMSNG
jgi:glycosyltransferase involved in cell wall biosynthesis